MIIFISLIPCCDCRITFALVEILKRVLNHACNINDKSEYARGEIEAKPKVHSDKWILRAF